MAIASVTVDGRVITGFGAAADQEQARNVAIMECAERWAQFGRLPKPVVRDCAEALGSDALDPRDFGLYAPHQYATPGLVPFDPQAPLDWLPVIEVATGAKRLIPVEFMHPQCQRQRPVLVAETSSGTAISFDADHAVNAATCELVERDAAMMLWYRRPQVPVLPIAYFPEAISSDVRAVTAEGFVVLVARIDIDIVVPTFLVLALKGARFSFGLGTHPDPEAALRHALVELGGALRSREPSDRYVHLPLSQVLRPEHHRGLYDNGPLQPSFRAFLDATLVRTEPHVGWGNAGASRAVDVGRPTYVGDLTPPELADRGAHVARALVPGLIPLSFGFHRLRLGCQRLVGPAAPGRLSTLLPHFLS